MDIQTLRRAYGPFCVFVPVLEFYDCCVVLVEVKEKKQQGKHTSYSR